MKKSQSMKELQINQSEEEDKEQQIPEFDAEKEALKYRPIRFYPNLSQGVTLNDLLRIKVQSDDFIQNNNHLKNILKSCLKPMKIKRPPLLGKFNSVNDNLLPIITQRKGSALDLTKNRQGSSMVQQFSKKFKEEDKFIVLASDGLYEFIDSEEVVNIVKDFYLKDDIVSCCEFLYKEQKIVQ